MVGGFSFAELNWDTPAFLIAEGEKPENFACAKMARMAGHEKKLEPLRNNSCRAAIETNIGC